MFVCFRVAGIISTGNEDEAEGPVEKANGEVQRRGGAGLRRSRQVRRAWYMKHTDFGSWNTVTSYTAVCLLVEEPKHTTHSPLFCLIWCSNFFHHFKLFWAQMFPLSVFSPPSSTCPLCLCAGSGSTCCPMRC